MMNLLIALATLGFALAHDFYITQPWAETSWKAGETVTITWKLYQNVGPEAGGINIDLMDGDDLAANLLLNVAANLRPESVSYDWTIPKSVSSSDRVFIRITGMGEVANYRFSHRFTITEGEGPGITASIAPTLLPPVNVSELVRAMPTVSKLRSIPPFPKLPDLGGEEELTTSTVSIPLPTGGKNKDRLAQSGSSKKQPIPYAIMVVGLLFMLV